jgi:hypothetical protein
MYPHRQFGRVLEVIGQASVAGVYEKNLVIEEASCKSDFATCLFMGLKNEYRIEHNNLSAGKWSTNPCVH